MTATDGFSAYIAAPAVARLRRDHPGLSVEIITVTRRALQQRSGLDIEVVVGEPQVHRAAAARLGEYMLGMYASRDYLAEYGTPTTVEELTAHSLVYFVDSMLQVDDLDAPRRLVPTMRDGLSSTNVFVHVEATRAGAGIGFLPCFAADLHPDLVRLLPEEFAELLPYWMVLRPDSMRRPAVAAVVQALRRADRKATARHSWAGAETHRLLRNRRFRGRKRAVTEQSTGVIWGRAGPGRRRRRPGPWRRSRCGRAPRRPAGGAPAGGRRRTAGRCRP